MRILFIFCRNEAYNSKTVRELPSGGTEKAVIFLGEALVKLGHDVVWCTTPRDLHIGLMHGFKEDWTPDVVVTQIAELLQHFPNAQRIWWTHHFSDQPVIKQNAHFARCYADKVVTLSRCHYEDFRFHLRLDSAIIGHGIWRHELDLTPKRDPFRLIYASTPFRGLDRIPKLFTEIRKHEPRATIAICSSMATYGEPAKDAQYKAIFGELAGIEGVELLGALNQAQLYAEYAKASIFFYPCIWPETYCMALDEAIAHGCQPMTTNLGALNRYGTAMENEAELLEWVKRVFRCEHHSFGSLIKDWLDVAKQWEELLNA